MLPSLSLGIIGLYFFLRWLCDRKMTPFYLAAIAIALSILIKVTSIVIAAPLACIVVGRLCQTPGVSQNALQFVAQSLFIAIVVLPSLVWYGMRVKSPKDSIRIISSVPVEFDWKVFRGTGTSRSKLRRRV